MNEKNYIRFIITLVIAAVILSGTVGFLVGRRNFIRPVGLEHTDRELAETVGELRAELGAERTITERIRSEQDEERILIRDALESCRRAGGGTQGIIAKMEILNGLIRELERRAGGGADLSGSE